MTERIVVRIGRDGKVDAQTEGTKGASCLDAIPLLEDLLEGLVVESRYTPEFYEQAQSGVVEQSVRQDDQQT